MSRITTHASVYDEPAYRAAEAAHMLALPPGTVKAWSFGQDYVHGDGTPKRFKALISAADHDSRLLSFNNLCELHMLAAIRRHYRVSMPAVRDSVAFVRKQLKMERPLLASEFQTNGLHLFIEHAGVMLNVSREGQTSLSQAWAASTQAIVITPSTGKRRPKTKSMVESRSDWPGSRRGAALRGDRSARIFIARSSPGTRPLSEREAQDTAPGVAV